MTTDKTAIAAQGNAVVTFAVSWTEDSTYTAAATYLVDANGNTKVWQNGVLVAGTPGEETHNYGKITVQLTDVVSATFGGGDPVAKASLTTDQKALLAGSYTMRVSASSTRVHLFASAPSAGHFLDA